MSETFLSRAIRPALECRAQPREGGRGDNIRLVTDRAPKHQTTASSGRLFPSRSAPGDTIEASDLIHLLGGE